jgi:lipoprotein-releasing system permease protein
LCIEENAMLEYGEKQIIATIKGVDDNYQSVTGLDTMIVNGNFQLYEKVILPDDIQQKIPLGIAGQGIAYNLELSTDFTQAVNIYIPSRTGQFRGNFQDASDNINRAIVYTSGIFMIQQEYDTKYYIIPLATAQELLEYENQVSSVEIKLKKDIKSKDAVSELSNLLGNQFEIQDRNKQHEYAYKIMQTEKWAIFMILVFILLIASFNVIGSLTMLIIDKKHDIQILKSLGAGNKTIRSIFFLEGIFISFLGAVAGLFVGGLISWLQMEFGLVKLGNEGSFIIDSYPVLINWTDFLYVIFTVMIIGTFAAWYPVRYITRKFASLEY